MSTHNICFYGEIANPFIILKYPPYLFQLSLCVELQLSYTVCASREGYGKTVLNRAFPICLVIITLVTWAGQKWILQIYLVLGPLCDVLSSAVTARRVKVLVLHFVCHHLVAHLVSSVKIKHTSRCETYYICEQRRLRRACTSAESRQSLPCFMHYRELSRGSFGQRARGLASLDGYAWAFEES